MQNNSNVGVRYYASGNLFIVKQVSKTIPRHFGGGRGAISRFSNDSAVRMRRYLRETLSKYLYMVTLTYPCGYPSDGKIVKEHLRRFLQELRRHHIGPVARPSHELDWSAFWFLEFQQRGAPHFHIFVTHPTELKWVSQKWYDIVNSEDPRHLRAGTKCERLRGGKAATISYASKYACKMAQKDVPEGYENVGRFWGVTGRRSTLSADTFVSRENMEDLQVQRIVKDVMWWGRALVEMGRAEVVVRKEGVLVLRIHDETSQRKLRAQVSRLSAKTMVWPAMFSDAEVYYSEAA